MANNKFNIDIVSTDRSAPGFDSLNKRMQAARKATAPLQQKYDELNKPIDRLSNVFKVFSGRGDIRRMVGDTEQLSLGLRRVATGVGGVGDGLEGLAAVAGGAIGVIGGVAVAYDAAITAGSKFAKDFARVGQQVSNSAGTLGVSPRFLQSFRGAAEAQGLDPSGAASAIGGIGAALHRVQYGQDPLATAALAKLNLSISDLVDKNGQLDVQRGTMALADRISKIKDPYAQAHAADIFGAEAALPLLRQGPARVQSAMDAYWSSGAGQTDDQLARSDKMARSYNRLDNIWYGLKKNLATAFMPFLGANLDAKASAIGMVAPGNRSATFRGLADRIEHRGERSRQDQISPKGAVGVMQLMPDTARQAAAYLGVKFDDRKYRQDEQYNRWLGEAWLNRLYRKYSGDQTLTAEAYNAGEGAVDDWIAGTNRSGKNRAGTHLGDPRKGEISDWDFAMRTPFAETRAYALRTADFAASGGSAPAQAGKVDVTVNFQGAPPGTTAVTKATGAVNAKVRVAHSTMDLQ